MSMGRFASDGMMFTTKARVVVFVDYLSGDQQLRDRKERVHGFRVEIRL